MMDDYESFDAGDRPHWISRAMEHLRRPADSFDGFLAGLIVAGTVAITAWLYFTGG